MKLGGLVMIYDSNRITIEGDVALAMADDTKKRFQSYGWKVLECDGHDYADIDRTYRKALKIEDAPVIIIATTHIGFGAPTKQDSADSHGAPLGAEEVAGAKKALGFDPEKSFYVPDEVYQLFAARTAFQHRMRNKDLRLKKAAGLPPPAKKASDDELIAALPKWEVGKSVATRNVSGEVMNALAPLVPELVGGSADLAPSNKTYMKGLGDIGPGAFEGRNIHYGIRELAMTAIANGLTAYGGFRGFGATFFVFSDYCRPAIRLAALMELPSIHVFSHDSFYVGEDGPTHEPIEQLAAMRVIPNVLMFRPADANETAYSWIEAIRNESGPSCILTTRQNLPVLEGVTREGVAKGAYVIWQAGRQDKDTVLFIATGSEVSLCIEAAKRIWNEDRRAVRVVSMPSQGRFLAQRCTYREMVIPEFMPIRVIVEAGSRFGWDRFRLDHRKTRFVTKDDFGASAPYKVLAKEYGFTAENVYEVARGLI
jgi:transketolase